MNEQMIELGKIDPNPFQVRLQEDPAKVEEIARSIAQVGLLQVPTARKVDGRYQLAFGHTRLAAFKLIARTQDAFDLMPLIVRELSDLEMFQVAVSENVQRRDLNPIEQAQAMRRYIDTFGQTSEQTGELFAVSAETVRGTIRLLKLPESIQAQLKSGAMTVSVARKFLSAQHVDASAVKKAEKAIGKLEEPGREAVERELDEALQQSKTAVAMWEDGRRNGEARGGPDLWPLAWQHNGRLEPLTAADLLAALGIEKTPTKAQSARLQDLHVELVAGMEIDPKRYAEFPAEGLERVAHLANPPTCIACPFYTRMQGTHYCGVKACWERKAECWTQLQLLQLSGKLKLPIYDATKDGKKFEIFEDNYSSGYASWWAALRSEKAPEHAGLRLMVFRAHPYHQYPATEHSRIVVINVGQALPKAKRETFGNGSDRREQNRRRDMLKRSETFVRDVATPIIGQAFAGIKSLRLLQALTHVDGRALKDMKDGAKLKYLQAELARLVLLGDLRDARVLPYRGTWTLNVWTRGPLAMSAELASLAKSWGVQVPGDWRRKAKEMMPKREPKAKAKGKGKR